MNSVSFHFFLSQLSVKKLTSTIHIFPEGNQPSSRRRRTKFSVEQLERLEESFETDKYPGIQKREDLARELNIGEGRIQVRWLISSHVKFKIPQYYCSLNEKFTSPKSSTLVPPRLTRFFRRNNYPGSLLV